MDQTPSMEVRITVVQLVVVRFSLLETDSLNRSYDSLPLDTVLSQVNIVHVRPSHLSKNNFNITVPTIVILIHLLCKMNSVIKMRFLQ